MRDWRVAEYHREQRRHDDADEDGALDIAHHQSARQHEAEEREHRRRIRDMTETDERRLVRDDESRALEADEGDEEADADADSDAQVLRHGIDDGLADMADRQDQEQDARKEDGAECDRPVETECTAYIVGKERIEAHARCECDRVVGEYAHNHRRECCDPDRRGDGRLLRDTCLRQDIWIDKDDISKCNECGKTCEDFRFDRRVLLTELEETIKEALIRLRLH